MDACKRAGDGGGIDLPRPPAWVTAAAIAPFATVNMGALMIRGSWVVGNHLWRRLSAMVSLEMVEKLQKENRNSSIFGLSINPAACQGNQLLTG